jgi:hypothetical protein
VYGVLHQNLYQQFHSKDLPFSAVLGWLFRLKICKKPTFAIRQNGVTTLFAPYLTVVYYLLINK